MLVIQCQLSGSATKYILETTGKYLYCRKSDVNNQDESLEREVFLNLVNVLYH